MPFQNDILLDSLATIRAGDMRNDIPIFQVVKPSEKI